MKTSDIVRKNDKKGYEFEEWRVFFMHTIWIRDESEMGKTVFKNVWKGDTLSRWFEWFLTIRTYTTIVPFGAKIRTERIRSTMLSQLRSSLYLVLTVS